MQLVRHGGRKYCVIDVVVDWLREIVALVGILDLDVTQAFFEIVRIQ
jgi:hypothetical protein